MMRKSIVPLIFCCCLSVAHSQDAATDDSAVDRTSGEQTQQETQGSAQPAAENGDAKKPSEQQKKKPEAAKPKPPKEVFKPTEEISEDSPVPFPVDI